MQITSFEYLEQVIHDARHEKTDLKVFVVVIPKEGWVRYDNDKDFVVVIPKEGWVRYDNDKDLRLLLV